MVQSKQLLSEESCELSCSSNICCRCSHLVCCLLKYSFCSCSSLCLRINVARLSSSSFLRLSSSSFFIRSSFSLGLQIRYCLSLFFRVSGDEASFFLTPQQLLLIGQISHSDTSTTLTFLFALAYLSSILLK